MLFNCRTDLVARFRTLFAEDFGYAGNRALLLDLAAPLPEAPLRLCLSMALTYHLDKRAQKPAPGSAR